MKRLAMPRICLSAALLVVLAGFGRAEDQQPGIARTANSHHVQRFTSGANPVTVAFAPDSRHVLWGDADGNVRLSAVATGNDVIRFDGCQGPRLCTVFSPDGRSIVAASDKIRIWNIDTGKVLHINRPATTVDFSPDGNSLLAAYRKELWIVDLKSGKETRRFEGHRWWISDAAFSPDGRFVVSSDQTASVDNAVYLWDARSGRELHRRFKVQRGVVRSVAFSPDSKSVLTGGVVTTHIPTAPRQTGVMQWNTQTGELIREFAGHTRPVAAVTFTTDGRHILSGGSDGTVRFWETATGRELAALDDHSAAVSCLAVSPDGRLAASGNADNTLRILSLPTGNASDPQRVVWNLPARIAQAEDPVTIDLNKASAEMSPEPTSGRRLAAAENRSSTPATRRPGPDESSDTPADAASQQNDTSEDAESDITIKLTGKLEDCGIAAAGELLVLRLAGEPKLHVYNCVKQDITGTITLPSANFTFGVGGRTAVVFVKDRVELQTWDLDSCTRTNSKGFIGDVDLSHIIMGHSRPDAALIRIDSAQTHQSQFQFLNVATLSIDRQAAQRQHHPHLDQFGREGVHFRANGAMSAVSMWRTRVVPQGVGLLIPDSDFDHWQTYYAHDSAGYLAMGDDGSIYSGYRGVLRGDVINDPRNIGNAEEIQLAAFPGLSLLPGIGGRFFLGVDNDWNLSVFETGTTVPLCRFGKVPLWQQLDIPVDPRRRRNSQTNAPAANVDSGNSRLTFDRRFIFAPSLGYLMFLPFSNDVIVRRPFDLKGILDETGRDYLLVLSAPPVHGDAGKRWTYQIEPLAKHGPVRYELEHAPEGMTISQSGLLEWKIPGNIEGHGNVKLRLTDTTAQEVRHDFAVTFD